MTGHELKLDISRTDNVRVININSELIDRLSVETVADQITAELTDADEPKVVICFDNIREVSSAILGALIKIDKQVRDRKGRLRLSGMQPNVEEVFRLTRLDTVLDIHPDSREAVRDFD